MIACNKKLFTLNDIDIIGGDYREILIRINDIDSGEILDITNLSVNFALVSYVDRNGSPILSKNLEISPVDSSAFILTLLPNDTVNLNGKYIYQISVKANDTKKVESFQGVMTIDKNINPTAFTTE